MSEFSETSTAKSSQPSPQVPRGALYVGLGMVSVIAFGVVAFSLPSINAQLAAQRGEIGRLEAAVVDLNARKQNLESSISQMAETEKNIENLSRRSDAAKKSLLMVEEQLSVARSQLADTQVKAAGLQSSIKDLTDRNKSADDLAGSLGRQLSDLNAGIKDARSNESSAKEAAKRAEDAKKAADLELLRVQRELGELEKKRAAVAGEESTLRGGVAELMGQRSQLVNILSAARADVARLRTEERDVRTEVERRKADLGKLEGAVEAQQKRANTLTAEESVSIANLTKLRADEKRLADIPPKFLQEDEKFKKLQQDITSASDTLERQRKLLQDASAALSDTNARKLGLDTEVKQLESQRDIAERAAKTARSSAATADADRQKAESELTTTRQALEQMRRSVALLEATQTELRRENENLERGKKELPEMKKNIATLQAERDFLWGEVESLKKQKNEQERAPATGGKQ